MEIVQPDRVYISLGPNGMELTLAQANALLALLAKKVIAEAIIQNGWDVQKYWRAPLRESEVPNGVILAYRKSRDDFLTAEFSCLENGEISFSGGHYDHQSYGDAKDDFADRCASKV